MGFYPYQEKATVDVKKAFETTRKVCLAASCSAGKTLIGYGYADDYIQAHPESKVLILTHGQILLRTQFDESSRDFEEKIRPFSPNFKKIVIGKCSDLLGNYDTHNVFIAIPQSIRKCSIPHFDLVIVDEGHQFYFANDGMVKTIIAKSGASQELVLTGTPSPFVAAGWPIIPIPMCDLYDKNPKKSFIQNVVVEMTASSYITKFDYDYNDDGELNREGQKRLTRKGTYDTLDTLLDFICKRATTLWKKNPKMASVFVKFPNWLQAVKSLKKTFIACKSQNQADYVQEYFARQGITALKSISREQTSLEADGAFKAFKTNPAVTVLIVVGRGVLGFNMPELMNVVDMTCSTNIDRIFQLFSRTVRKSADPKCQKLFLKVVPELFHNYSGHDYFLHVMTAVLCMTGPDWFTKYDGHNFKNLKLPSVKGLRSGLRGKKGKKAKGLPQVKVWLGFGAIQFFKNIYHKDNKGNYSYAFTTMGRVQQELLGQGWRSDEALESKSLKICDEAIKCLNYYGGMPPFKSKSKKERFIYSWLSQLKLIKNKVITNKRLYPSVEEKIKNSGYYGLIFEYSKEKVAIEHAYKLRNFLNSNFRIEPKVRSKDPLQRQTANWLVSMRQAKRKKNKGQEIPNRTFYPSVEKILTDAGYPGIFNDNYNKEQIELKKAEKLIEYLKKYGMPNRRSKIKEERVIGVWLYTSKKKYRRGKLYPSVIKKLTDADYPDIFTPKR